MHSFELRIPPELAESVIDEVTAFSHTPTCTSTLSSLALVSHAFRHRVNKHRFREITLIRTDEVRVFAFLLKTDSRLWPQDEGLHAYIRKVKIFLGGSRHGNMDVLPMLNSGYMKFILDKLFRRYTRDHAPALSFSLVWGVTVGCERLSDSDERYQLDWEDLDDDLQSSFLNMVQESCLTDLHVLSLDNIPRDLVHKCDISTLSFVNVTFASSLDLDQSTEGILDSWHLEHINEFTTDHSTSPMDYIGTVAYHASPSTPIFPNLNHLVCCICDDKEYEMTVALMQRATMLDTLSLTLLGKS
jgi:hypothetical protein